MLQPQVSGGSIWPAAAAGGALCNSSATSPGAEATTERQRLGTVALVTCLRVRCPGGIGLASARTAMLTWREPPWSGLPPRAAFLFLALCFAPVALKRARGADGAK